MNEDGGSDLRSSEAEEIIGGLVNAVERGETLQNAMQTFVNAGYDPQFLFKVSERAYYDGKIPVKEDSLNEESSGSEKSNESKKKNKDKLKLFNFGKDKKKLYIILMIVVSVFVLVGALLLGLFWNKLF